MRYIQQNGILVPQTSRNRQRGFITCGPAFFGGAASASGGDSLYASVFSLLPMQGTNGSTTFTDQISGRAWTVTSPAQISTAQSPFTGGSSGSFASGYLTTNTLTDWIFLQTSVASWTLDIWARPSAIGTTIGILGDNQGSSDNRGIGIWIDPSGKLRVFITGTGVSALNFTSASAVFSVNTWALVSVQFNTSTVTLSTYINGTGAGSLVGTLANFSGGAPQFALNVGALGGGAFKFNGYLADMRITKALRYTGDFTPPTEPFPTHS